MRKFIALIPFAALGEVYYPHKSEPYEIDEDDVSSAWEKAGYIEFVDGEKTPQTGESEPQDDFVILTVDQLKKKYTADELKAEIAARGIEGDVEDKTKNELISMIRGE